MRTPDQLNTLCRAAYVDAVDLVNHRDKATTIAEAIVKDCAESIETISEFIFLNPRPQRN